MTEFVDRIQETPNRIKLTPVEGAESTFDIEAVGAVTAEGTDINRAKLMAVQGFSAQTITFLKDANGKIVKITETNSEGHTKTTTFSENTVTEKFVGIKTITKKTTFNTDGSITEELV